MITIIKNALESWKIKIEISLFKIRIYSPIIVYVVDCDLNDYTIEITRKEWRRRKKEIIWGYVKNHSVKLSPGGWSKTSAYAVFNKPKEAEIFKRRVRRFSMMNEGKLISL